MSPVAEEPVPQSWAGPASGFRDPVERRIAGRREPERFSRTARSAVGRAIVAGAGDGAVGIDGEGDGGGDI